MDRQKLWGSGIIPSKTILILSKNFLDFGLNMIEKQGIINLSKYNSESYTSAVLSDSEVAILAKGKDATFY